MTRATRPSVHVSIDVPELEAGLRFYGEVFGFVETARPFPTMAILDANNVSVCLHAKAAGSASSSAAAGTERRRYERHWTPVHLDLHVADFDAVLDAIRAGGGLVELLRNAGLGRRLFGLSVADIETALYNDSGLKGLSGLSNDMRTLEKADTVEANQAIDYFVMRANIRRRMRRGA